MIIITFDVSIVMAYNPISINAISCHQNINISLNENCESLLDPSDILSVPPHPSEPHELILTDNDGNEILDDLITEEHLWTNIMAKVINTITGNSCWSTIKIEDKNPPNIDCESVTIPCWDTGENLPEHFDNCTTSSLVMLSEVLLPDPCDAEIIKVIEREWLAVDSFGNKSPKCLQTIMLERIDFGDIVFPPNLEVSSMSNLTCESVVFDENGFPSIDSTGVPTIEGVPLYPIQDIYCSLGVDYEDFLITDQNCVQKYMRTWRVFEATCSARVGNFAVVPQTIEISDSELPTISCPKPRTVSTAGGDLCKANTSLELPIITDDCSGTTKLNISYSGPFIQDVKTPPAVELNIGVTSIEYTVYDACDNSATCLTNITVIDNSSPVANCDDSKIVSLRSSGTAYAPVSSFDNGSTDDCAFYKSLVRKDSQTCDCVQPEFNDMAYVGEHNGKYYYVSTIERFGSEAFDYSTAYGGSIVIAETEEEYDWLVEAVRKVTEDDFLIGLKDKTGDGYFTWNDHSIPVYNKWGLSEPTDIGQNVIVNQMGYWNTFDGVMNRALFVTEFDDICGFSDFVHFCCEDAMVNPTLTIRAIDLFGRYNECTITVEIQDKVAPVIVCPSNRSLDCDTQIDFGNLDVYGMATATDECLTGSITSTYEEDVTACGVGDIIRTFIASDPTGESTCQQIISLGENKPASFGTIKWPTDLTTIEGCNSGDLSPENLPTPNGFPELENEPCSILTATHSDQTYSFAASGSDACLKILRTWTVVDDCLKDSPGYIPETYQQTIKVINNIGPEIISGCSDVVLQTSNCTDASLEILVTATDDCTSPQNLRSRIQIDLNSDGGGVFDEEVDGFDGTVKYEYTYPIGDHFALIEFIDECGNPNTCSKRISVENNIPPVSACVSGLTSMIQDMDTNGDGNTDSQMTMLFARMLDRANASTMLTGSSHPCGLDFSLSLSADVNDTIAIFDCSHVGQNNSLVLWVTDDAGNTHTCSAIIDIQDDQNRCSPSTINMVEINGEIHTWANEPIENVSVNLEGTETPSITTTADGEFAFPEMPTGGYYSVVPSRNDDPLNGVSTLDLVIIQRHILGLSDLDSPYKMIAADVDKSGSISVIDMIELRKLILGIDTEFKNNESWRMINGEFEFIDNADPFSSDLPESYDIFKLEKNMNLNFVGIKIGDVDNSVRFNSIQNIGTRSRIDDAINMTIEENELSKFKSQSIGFKLDDNYTIDGFQIALDINTELVEVLGVKPLVDGLTISNFNQKSLTDGDIRISWNSIDFELEAGNNLFEIIVRAKEDVYVSEIMELAYENLMPEIYINSEASALKLNYKVIDELQDQIKLYQNVPNPWSEYTQVKFYTPSSKSIRFNLYDVNGKVIYQQLNQANQGVNIIEIDKSMINQSGVLYYEIIIDNVRLMDKMILLN